jgi:hypothetical protein
VLKLGGTVGLQGAGVAFLAGKVYFAMRLTGIPAAEGKIFVNTLEGGAPTVIATAQTPVDVRAIGSHIYFCSNEGLKRIRVLP